MIDVRLVITHGLWIVGAAIVLAAFSFYDWLARTQQRRLREVLRSERGWQLSTATGLLLFASAILVSESTRWWVWFACLAVGIGALYDLWRLRARS